MGEYRKKNSKFKDRSIKNIQSEEHRERRLKNMNSASVICEIMSSFPRRRGECIWGRKEFKEITTENVPILVEIINQDLKNLSEPHPD